MNFKSNIPMTWAFRRFSKKSQQTLTFPEDSHISGGSFVLGSGDSHHLPKHDRRTTNRLGVEFLASNEEPRVSVELTKLTHYHALWIQTLSFELSPVNTSEGTCLDPDGDYNRL